jgi:hypothetical protein
MAKKKLKPAAKPLRRTAKRRSPAIKPPVKAAAPTRSSSVRNTVVPTRELKKTPAVVTFEGIAKRAYEISISGQGGSEMDNWLRAERELRAGL